MKVALVHDWLTGMRGGERVLEALLELHPRAELFTLLHVPGSVSAVIEDRPIHTSFLQRLPAAAHGYRYLLPLFPRAVESLDLRGFDLVISSSHCVAKGALAPPGVPHLCYCHTPMRYVWDQYDAYFGPGRASWPVRAAMRVAAPRLRSWDVRSAGRVHRFLANSRHVRERIRRCYGRPATVVHPPVDLDRFAPAPARDDYYLVLGAPAPYKRVDLAVEAFARLGRPLVVVGAGVGGASGVSLLRGRAPANVTFAGAVDDAGVADLLARARALVLPGVEDFGISVVEALASGTPVIALGHGGVLDSVRPLGGDAPEPPTGVFFREPTPDALIDAVGRFEAHAFDPAVLTASARPFGRSRFLEAVRREQEVLLSTTPRAAPPTDRRGSP
jgi:glycosyltransferase involved in cell wall biosynthesis